MTIGDVTASIAIRRGRKGDPTNRETAQKHAKNPQTATDFSRIPKSQIQGDPLYES